ncbi:hypothetical protein EJB05_06123 [Eragrostis curvula]|uniref:Uncharacterized protein n=1 Tax=Eragrostis curvula TaxID=38414 RepID=A0A5J9WEW5_9POAL|nr:hypothetical protein EJB05_06123 [Eragrostis curvula]
MAIVATKDGAENQRKGQNASGKTFLYELHGLKGKETRLGFEFYVRNLWENNPTPKLLEQSISWSSSKIITANIAASRISICISSTISWVALHRPSDITSL